MSLHILGSADVALCTAKSRTGTKCDRPAVKFCPAPRCDWHGGATTPEGIQRIREANWKHGERTAQAEREASRLAVHIRRCDDALRVLGAISGNRRVGRVPSAYKPIKTQADVEAFVEELLRNGSCSQIGEQEAHRTPPCGEFVS